MHVVFLFPMAFAAAATFFLFTSDDYGPIAKGFALLVMGASFAMQFVPALQVHFLIPFFLQLGICFWYLFDRQING